MAGRLFGKLRGLEDWNKNDGLIGAFNNQSLPTLLAYPRRSQTAQELAVWSAVHDLPSLDGSPCGEISKLENESREIITMGLTQKPFLPTERREMLWQSEAEPQHLAA